ncbi:MAG: helix-turn-helix domain-containing protein [Eubacteriales bacterium]|nr:helix-turn-helix domain-containing protein [Eubacteriales bacterium]
MLKENLVMLRSLHGFSQEEIAEKINISRQAYAKWETGATVPDIEKCRLLASVYGVTLDSLANSDSAQGSGTTLAPQGKNIWGSVIINDRGQIVIPKGVREKFNLAGGTRMIVLSDDDGVALIPAGKFEQKMQQIIELAATENEND